MNFPDITIDNIRNYVIGLDEKVPLRDGSEVRYVNFDNAASTPTFTFIYEKIGEFLKWYSNVHRGTGFKSQISSRVFEDARSLVAEFVGADLDEKVVVFTKNSTESINKLARRIPFNDKDVVLTTLMEHHSNELPWRRTASKIDHVGLLDDGTLDLHHLESLLKKYDGHVRVVAVSGASNFTGYINSIGDAARLAHSHGAHILVDAAQLAPHRPINVKRKGDPEHIDFLVFSAHKMYAPFGVGALVGDRATFGQGDPDQVGGGMVDIVTLEDAYWTDLPEKEEAGTPDIVGVVAFAETVKMYEKIGWENIVQHEADLTRYALSKLNSLDGVRIFGDDRPETARSRLGVISFNVGELPHALVASILSYEAGIGVRSGCFCAHTYVKSLLHVSPTDALILERDIINRDRSRLPGMVRVSFGIYNSTEEIDRLVGATKRIIAGDFRDDYELNKEKGDYTPSGLVFHPDPYFRL
jgi:cysteine desulfurase/selenocysteine lyase